VENLALNNASKRLCSYARLIRKLQPNAVLDAIVSTAQKQKHENGRDKQDAKLSNIQTCDRGLHSSRVFARDKCLFSFERLFPTGLLAEQPSQIVKSDQHRLSIVSAAATMSFRLILRFLQRIIIKLRRDLRIIVVLARMLLDISHNALRHSARLDHRRDFAGLLDMALDALDEGVGLALSLGASGRVTLHANRRFVLARLQRAVVEAHDHARQVVCAEARQRMVHQLLRRRLRVRVVAHQVHGFLVGAHVPEL